MAAATTEIFFPEGTTIRVSGAAVSKPWGDVPSEPFAAKTLRPMTQNETIDTLIALWQAHSATDCTLAFGAYFIHFSPEQGFYLTASQRESAPEVWERIQVGAEKDTTPTTLTPGELGAMVKGQLV